MIELGNPGCRNPRFLSTEVDLSITRVGFFRELRHGQPDGPSLASAKGMLQDPERARIADYLASGTVLATSGRMVDDFFDRGNSKVATLDIRTDGRYVWPGDLAYYVSRYSVELPAAFREHMRQTNYIPRQLEHAELSELERSL
jgi:hypothetical protein